MGHEFPAADIEIAAASGWRHVDTLWPRATHDHPFGVFEHRTGDGRTWRVLLTPNHMNTVAPNAYNACEDEGGDVDHAAYTIAFIEGIAHLDARLVGSNYHGYGTVKLPQIHFILGHDPGNWRTGRECFIDPWAAPSGSAAAERFSEEFAAACRAGLKRADEVNAQELKMERVGATLIARSAGSAAAARYRIATMRAGYSLRNMSILDGKTFTDDGIVHERSTAGGVTVLRGTRVTVNSTRGRGSIVDRLLCIRGKSIPATIAQSCTDRDLDDIVDDPRTNGAGLKVEAVWTKENAKGTRSYIRIAADTLSGRTLDEHMDEVAATAPDE